MKKRLSDEKALFFFTLPFRRCLRVWIIETIGGVRSKRGTKLNDRFCYGHYTIKDY